MEMNKILVVDDEKNIRLTLSQALETLGMPIQTAGDGEAALQKLKESDFSLVLLDLKLPGMDGWNPAPDPGILAQDSSDHDYGPRDNRLRR